MPIALTSNRPVKYHIKALLVVAAVIAFMPLSAHADEEEAKLALSRAEAKIELVQRSTVPTPDSPALLASQRRIAAAREAFQRDRNRDAERYAIEAEAWADASASESELAALERTRDELARAIDILASEVSGAR